MKALTTTLAAAMAFGAASAANAQEIDIDKDGLEKRGKIYSPGNISDVDYGIVVLPGVKEDGGDLRCVYVSGNRRFALDCDWGSNKAPAPAAQ